MAGPDPYRPSSAAFVERNAVHVIDLSNGLTRTDIGEPLKPLPCEAQPVSLGSPKAVPAKAPPPPQLPTSAAAKPAARPSQEPRAITREP